MRDGWIGLVLLAGCACLLISCGGAPSATSPQSGAGGQSGSGEWTWMSGSSTISSAGYQPGVYGTLGTPALANVPGGRGGAVTWTDLSGNLWLFGGSYATESPTRVYSLNDLWKYDLKNNEWTWMGGSDSPPCSTIESGVQCAQSGVYGALGKPAATNVPGGRFEAVSWTDPVGDFWLYGGLGFDSVGQWGLLNDLWKYDPNADMWTWTGGDTELPGNGMGDPGVYGTLGTPGVGNNPGALASPALSTDAKGNAWLFGGTGSDENGALGLPNNLWKFDSSLGQWAWLEGSATFSTPWFHPSTYGTMGTPAPANVPGSRWQSSAWTDPDGNLWLFGGQGFDSLGNSGFLNELWQFNPSNNEWVWIAGSNTMSCAPGSMNQNCGNTGVYGSKGTPAAGNLPGGRTNALSWTDSKGHFWLFGGNGFNASLFSSLDDFWEFDPNAKQWTWMGGNSGPASVSAVYGTQGVPAPGNYPGGRASSATWVDRNGDFWLFGGHAFDARGNSGLANDLWKYVP